MWCQSSEWGKARAGSLCGHSTNGRSQHLGHFPELVKGHQNQVDFYDAREVVGLVIGKRRINSSLVSLFVPLSKLPSLWADFLDYCKVATAQTGLTFTQSYPETE